MDSAAPFFASVDRGDAREVGLALAGTPELAQARLHGATPLHHAAARGDVGLLETLLAAGAALEAQDDAGTTALAWATEEERDEAVDFLLARGGRATAVDLAARGLDDRLAEALDEAPWMLAQLTARGTALHAAIRRSRERCVELLLARGADPSERDGDGWTADELAQRVGQRSILRLLERARLAGGGPSAHASESVHYRCGACAEEIVIDVDRTEGEDQRFVEDCPVCCRANAIEVHFGAGAPLARAELE